MKSNLIFIEGIPGSGKTTLANKLNNKLKEYYNTEMRQEGDLHPIDVCWCSVQTKESFEDTLEKYPGISEQIKNFTKLVNGYYITAYTKIKTTPSERDFYQDMEKQELYSIIDLEQFQQFHQYLYTAFNNTFDPNTLYIFECSLLQNHINEHLLKFDSSMTQIIEYFTDLINRVYKLHPIIFYLSPLYPEQTIQHVIEERKSPNPELYNDWIDNVISYISKQPKAKKYGYLEAKDMIRYFMKRQEVELNLLKVLPVQKFIYTVHQNYDEILQNMVFDALKTIGGYNEKTS
jgi:hypothetical protein